MHWIQTAVIASACFAGAVTQQPSENPLQRGHRVRTTPGIYGLVFDEAGRPFPLRVEDKTGRTVRFGGPSLEGFTPTPTGRKFDFPDIAPGIDTKTTGGFTLRHKAPGVYKIGMVVDGYAYQEKEVTLEENKPAYVTFDLKKGNRIEGQMLDEAGRPIPGAQMRMTVERIGSLSQGDQRRGELRIPSEGFFDDKGGFSLWLRPDQITIGYYTLVASAPGYVPQTRTVRLDLNQIQTVKFALKKAAS